MAIDPISIAVGSFVLGKLAEKAIDVTVEKGAGKLAHSRAGFAERRQFQKVLDETWAAFERDPNVDRSLARSLRAILWERSANAQRFRAEAVKVLWSAEEPSVTALAQLYEEKLRWATDVWGEMDAPEWNDLEAPLTRFFELLRDRLLDDKRLGKAMAERSRLDWLGSAADALMAVQDLWEGATTETGAVRVVLEKPRGPTEEEWAEAKRRYLEHVIEKHHNLSLFITQLYGGQVPPMAELEKVFVHVNLQRRQRPSDADVKLRIEDRLVEVMRDEVEGLPSEMELPLRDPVQHPPEVAGEIVSIGEAMAENPRLVSWPISSGSAVS